MVSDVLGMSGRAILEALIRGESDPEKLVELTSRRLKASREELVEALRGRVTAHHRFMLQVHLRQIDSLEQAIGLLEEQAAEALAPYRGLVERLATIPGMSDLTAHTILAEVGWRWSACPPPSTWSRGPASRPARTRAQGSAARTGRAREGGSRRCSCKAAWTVVRKREGHLYAKFLRIKARRGGKKAAVAVAASILTAAYYIIQRGTEFQDLGTDYYDQRTPADRAPHLVRRLRTLGYEVHPRTAA